MSAWRGRAWSLITRVVKFKTEERGRKQITGPRRRRRLRVRID